MTPSTCTTKETSMPSFDLPDSRDLRTAPQLAPLALLDAALLTADQALRLEHYQLRSPNPHDLDEPPESLLAVLLAERIRELHALVAAYITNAHRACQDIPF